MDTGWSLKHLHRLIVSSETYRQSSRLTELGKSVDPENRLLSRGPRFRADAEIVKDIALTASGLLSRRIGGPPTHPPAPALLFKRPVSFSEKPWPTSTGEGRYRRGLYAFQYISAPYPVFETFDARNGATACVERSRSNTPLQALTTLKEELFMDASRALARRIASTDAGDDDQLEHAYRLCLSRPPLPEERALLEELLSRTRSQLAAGAGIRPRVTVGRTDDLGFNSVEDPVHVHDLHATILHLLGFDHTKLTYRFQGGDFRLTDASGNVVPQLLA